VRRRFERPVEVSDTFVDAVKTVLERTRRESLAEVDARSFTSPLAWSCVAQP